MDTARLQTIVSELEHEVTTQEAHLDNLRNLLSAAQKVLADAVPPAAARAAWSSQATPAPARKRDTSGLRKAAIPAQDPNRPTLREAIPLVMREMRDRGATGVTLASVTDELWRRGWVGTMKNGKSSKDTVRAVLLQLQQAGTVRGEKRTDGPWAETSWVLSSNTPRAISHASASYAIPLTGLREG